MNSDFIKDLEQQGIKRLLELVRNSSGRIKSLIEAIIRDKIKSKKYLISINEEEINKKKNGKLSWKSLVNELNSTGSLCSRVK